MDEASQYPQLIMDSLRRIVQTLRRSSSYCEQLTGMTGATIFVLKQIQEKEGLSLNELAARTFTHQSTMSGVVNRLESKGLVQRNKSADDARRLEIHLSAAGKAALVPGCATAQEALIHAIAALPDETMAHLAHGLSQLIQTANLSDQPVVMFFDDGRSPTALPKTTPHKIPETPK